MDLFGWLREPDEIRAAEERLRLIARQFDDRVARYDENVDPPSIAEHPAPEMELELASHFLNLANVRVTHRSVVVALTVSVASLLISLAAVVVAVIAL